MKHQGSTDYSVNVRMCVLKHLWANYFWPFCTRSVYTYSNCDWGIPLHP